MAKSVDGRAEAPGSQGRRNTVQLRSNEASRDASTARAIDLAFRWPLLAARDDGRLEHAVDVFTHRADVRADAGLQADLHHAFADSLRSQKEDEVGAIAAL